MKRETRSLLTNNIREQFPLGLNKRETSGQCGGRQEGAVAGVAKPGLGLEPEYEPAQEVVERIWTGAKQLCGKRLAPALELWLPHYARHYGSLLPTQKNVFWSIRR